jgi:hypothetical protein
VSVSTGIWIVASVLYLLAVGYFSAILILAFSKGFKPLPKMNIREDLKIQSENLRRFGEAMNSAARDIRDSYYDNEDPLGELKRSSERQDLLLAELKERNARLQEITSEHQESLTSSLYEVAKSIQDIRNSRLKRERKYGPYKLRKGSKKSVRGGRLLNGRIVL